MCVKNSVHRGACVVARGVGVVAWGRGCQGVCMAARGWGMHGCRGMCGCWGGHAWMPEGMCGCQGVCMVARGGVCGCGGHAWLWRGACVVVGGGVHRIRQDTVNERAVRILLECILVLILKLMHILSGGSRISQTGAPTSVYGKNLLFGKIFAENYMKMKKLGLRGARIPSAPS